MSVELRKQYEAETGEHVLHRVGSSDYHTLKYVQWLERRSAASPAPLEGLRKANSLLCRHLSRRGPLGIVGPSEDDIKEARYLIGAAITALSPAEGEGTKGRSRRRL